MFETYRALLAKADAKFAEVEGRHPSAFQCRSGCHGCCLPGLSVSSLEAAHISAYLADHPDVARRAAAAEKDDPHHGKRCAFLDAAGACTIYEVRPLICRTHGMPVKYKTEDGALARDVCPLNFTSTPVASLPEQDVLHLDTVNTILALLNEQFAPGQGGARAPLTPSHMLPDRE